ncbi:hypothetical protein [Paenibacillus sp. S150]|uniref:hypothetical protein n=1 Tax=Paenibacillus sp. S150 TaxID=2749826 RepID=UPI001C57F3AA|nr:hypothetical protein [Paenibacillus sp. S150]MBW4084943.1 hypothetical protein [Paenibacillus sp. S150]
MFFLKKAKLFSAILSSVLLVTSLGATASATNVNISTNQKFIQVDKNENVASTVINSIKSSNGQLKNVETGEIIDLEVESASTQIVNDDTNIQSNRGVTADTTTKYKTEAVLRATSDTISDNKSDNSLGMTVFMTIYFSTYSKSLRTYVGIDKISYRFEVYDTSITVSNKKIEIVQVGVGYYSGSSLLNQVTTRNALLSETILVSGFGWEPVGLAANYYANITAVLSRGISSNWNFNFPLVIPSFNP